MWYKYVLNDVEDVWEFKQDGFMEEVKCIAVTQVLLHSYFLLLGVYKSLFKNLH